MAWKLNGRDGGTAPSSLGVIYSGSAFGETCFMGVVGVGGMALLSGAALRAVKYGGSAFGEVCFMGWVGMGGMACRASGRGGVLGPRFRGDDSGAG